MAGLRILRLFFENRKLKTQSPIPPERNIMYQISFVIPRGSLLLYLVDIKISYWDVWKWPIWGGQYGQKPTKTTFSLVASKVHGSIFPARNIMYQISFVIPRVTLPLYVVDIKISYWDVWKWPISGGKYGQKPIKT